MEFLNIWAILVRRKRIFWGIFFAFILTSVVGTQLVTPFYKAQAKILIDTPDALTSLMANLGMKSSTKAAATSSSPYETDIALAQIRPLLTSLVSSLSLKDRSGNPLKPQKLVSRTLIDRICPGPYLKVKQYKDSDIIEILAFSANSAEAANMANKLAELYSNQRIEMTRKEYTATRLVIESRLQEVKEEYNNTLYAVKDFKTRHGVADPSVEIEGLIKKIISLKGSYEDNELAIQKYEVEAGGAEEKLKEMKMFTKQTEQFTSDLVKSLKSKLNELLIDIAGKSADITKEHPDYKKSEKQIAAIKELMMSDAKVFLSGESYTIDPVYQSLTTKLVEDYIGREVVIAKRKLLKKYIDEYENELFRMPEKSAEMAKLEVALTASKTVYQKLLEYLPQVRVAEYITLSKIKIVDRAVTPEEPDIPKKSLNYIIGIFLGMFWGLAGAFFKEYIDNTVRSPAEVRRITSSAPLGTIPKTASLENMNTIASFEPTHSAVEAFRTIKNNILFMPVEKPVKTLVVTSSLKSEGKSSIAANLAIKFGMDGKRVVLVDLNLREPSLGGYFKIGEIKGLTDVIIGDTGVENAIVHRTPAGIDLLLSGTITADPGKVIDSVKFKDIIKSLQDGYEMVVIDAPSVISASDAVVAGRLADGIIYVVGYGMTTAPLIEDSTEIMRRAGINILGTVFNNVPLHETKFQ